MSATDRGKDAWVTTRPGAPARTGADDRAPAPAAPGHPTDPSDYGAINLAYLALFAGALTATTRRRGADEAIPAREIVPLGVATFALSKVIAREKIGTWVREPFVEEDAEHQPGPPRGRGLRHAVGELLTCPRCVGAWAALGLVSLRTVSPSAGRTATTVLAASGVNDFLHAAFRLTAERANDGGG